MKIISQPIKHNELREMLPGYFGDMIKAVVDVKQDVQDPAVRKQIIDTVNKLIQ